MVSCEHLVNTGYEIERRHRKRIMDLKEDRRRTTEPEKRKENTAERFFRQSLERVRALRINKSVLIFGAAVILVVLAALYLHFRVSREYDILSTSQNEDTQSSAYVCLGRNLLKFGNEGVSLLDQSQQVIWNQTYEMTEPNADVSGDYAVIYDKNGTSMYVVQAEKPIGAIQVKFPVLEAKVARNGAVAAILEDGEKTWINYYASDGSLIAENQTSMENPGYPEDLAVSPNGESILVSYFQLENGIVSSYVACYNFSDEGQNQVDNIVAGFTYDNILVPQIVWINETTAVAFRENGFSVYDGSGVPKERVAKEVEGEIVSTFYNDKYIGLVFQEGEEDEKYTLKLYDISGKERVSQGFDLEYSSIGISGDRLILYNDTHISMYNLNGTLKFDSDIDEGAVKYIFQAASNRYILVSENGIHTIKTK